jgi:hypothetical protein
MYRWVDALLGLGLSSRPAKVLVGCGSCVRTLVPSEANDLLLEELGWAGLRPGRRPRRRLA